MKGERSWRSVATKIRRPWRVSSGKAGRAARTAAGNERETVDVVKTATPDIGELTRLMETFNQATERLGHSYQKIGELQREIAEKDRRLAQKTRLEMLGRMAANLAHEIRNPLGGIQLYASMLKRDLGQDADKVRVLD